MPIRRFDIGPKANHWPNSIKIGQSHDFDYYCGRGQGTLKHTLDTLENDPRKKWMRFLKSPPSKTPG